MATNFGFEPVLTGKRYFISYKTEDTGRVGEIARRFNQKGVPMWYDYGIPVGSRWRKEIEKNIIESEAVLIFITKNVFAHRNTYIVTEYKLAQLYKKRIIVIWLDDFGHHANHTDSVNARMLDWFKEIKELQGINVAGKSLDEIVWIIINRLKLFHGNRPQPATPINPYSEIIKNKENDSGLAAVALIILGLLAAGIALYVSQGNTLFLTDWDWEISDGEVTHRYKLISGNTSWPEAWKRSLETGGYLARLETEEEYKQIVDKLGSNSETSKLWYIYLGGERDEMGAYRWKSEDGEYLEGDLADSSLWYMGYWYPGEPSFTDEDEGRTIEETCITLMKVDEKWYFNDSNIDLTSAYSDLAGDDIAYLVEFEVANPIESAVTKNYGKISDDGTTITIIGNISVPTDEFIFPESSSRLLTEEELDTLKGESREESYFRAQLAINEILVRYGHKYRSSSDTAQAMRDKYDGKEWYEQASKLCPTDKVSELENYMNEIEKENIDLIVKWQDINGDE